MFFSNLNKHFLNKISNTKKIDNLKVKKNLFLTNRKFYLGTTQLLLYIPLPWELILFQKKQNYVIYLYAPSYFFRFPIPKDFIKINFNKNSYILSIENLYPNNYYKIYWFYLNEIFTSLNKPHFLKLKFKGKGYYIYKNKRNTITPQFGYAHRIYLYAYFVTVKFLSKTSIIVFGFSKKDIFKVSHGIKQMRPINIFTGRGVRFSRTIVYRKQGKVSSYR